MLKLKRYIKGDLTQLDELNLELAHYRIEFGMSPQLIKIYTQMGRLNSQLFTAKETAKKIDTLVEQLESEFDGEF